MTEDVHFALLAVGVILFSPAKSQNCCRKMASAAASLSRSYAIKKKKPDESAEETAAKKTLIPPEKEREFDVELDMLMLNGSVPLFTHEYLKLY